MGGDDDDGASTQWAREGKGGFQRQADASQDALGYIPMLNGCSSVVINRETSSCPNANKDRPQTPAYHSRPQYRPIQLRSTCLLDDIPKASVVGGVKYEASSVETNLFIADLRCEGDDGQGEDAVANKLRHTHIIGTPPLELKNQDEATPSTV